ncbi:hypothetical protein SAMN05216244_3595 [Sediminibacillus halophilus]|uniref:Uncharacterized protein n=1 Tax=Sediminibacillus halophilus TaxID=482461 RepID=A0A1G9WRL1_9BACI|nr:hypothetical protein SAMN05216244_3595 [Sediminibacillus halophilus]
MFLLQTVKNAWNRDCVPGIFLIMCDVMGEDNWLIKRLFKTSIFEKGNDQPAFSGISRDERSHFR